MKADSPETQRIQPVILCGGTGTRLWPASRKSLPKQFLPLMGDMTMLQDTAILVWDESLFEPSILVTNENFEFLAKRQMNDAQTPASLYFLEPEGRNTAPAIAMAALSVCQHNQDSILLVMPSDHVIGDPAAFKRMVKLGARAANDGAIVTFGMHAHSPETGYGYICKNGPLPYGKGCYNVASFVEKPSLSVAKELVEGGKHYWNSGIFMFSAEQYLYELQQFEPQLFADCINAFRGGTRSEDTRRPDPETFSEIKSISVDYAVMERTGNAVVVAADIGWSDVGSWPSFSEQLSPDGAGNVTNCSVVLEDCTGTCVYGNDRLITAIGLDDHIIIDTPDALFVAPKDRAQEVKDIVSTLRLENRKEADFHNKVHRPWGTYEGIDLGATHQVKHIVVYPGEVLSLQYHHHRAEHWVIVAGTAEVTVGAEVSRLGPNQNVFIPVGAVHRLRNPGTEPVHLIEVQCGDYLGEDDIVRLEDVYGRIKDGPLVAAE